MSTTLSTPAPAAPRPRRLRPPVLVAQLAILVILFGSWELGVRAGYINGFLFGSPAGVVDAAWKLIRSGELAEHAAYTLWASALGFVVGTALGTVPGLSLWYSPYAAKVVEPILVAINSVPKIAFAPLVILWFGTGVISKVALSISLTAIVALLAAFQAAKDTDPDIQRMMVSLGATKGQVFGKVVVPAALPYIISTFRINIGFALVGTVVGEFISSKYGIGHVIFVASSLYDLNTVWVGIFTLMLLGFVLYAGVDIAEKRLLRWKDQTYATQFKL
ncbi:MAG: ABC transporter permease [Achromobacter sp.]|jgi:NitT/TauT family transport system permease protein|uniref:Riboflavin transport system permease protein RibX n=1 Tax=Achromobacter insuavis TaxID=1287735 RepID=A0A6J4ZVP8_9BURK|nr:MULTISPECIES: ABC transporter permease [Achromobacter]MBN9639201.1 ABC transporter permease [Achromobacter sp.]CAB3644321.1 Riboflavin transport system permease protein RibX [Achromobacter insuavis]CUI36677.1 Putative aliphatic sulfonates transport permease protein ssuC [Achromobacter sp. 2789STDY5608628]CUI51349.1 Putative aliphatic sulfonates transport permease protein ssuC [Achromobacter sp. 2789STDY5608633]CUJ65468.1 Putative aliphatic sulfonates transport permease protein ssuC [Achromo